jgi:hypothetical protein
MTGEIQRLTKGNKSPAARRLIDGTVKAGITQALRDYGCKSGTKIAVRGGSCGYYGVYMKNRGDYLGMYNAELNKFVA